jgi:hypothetical protein
VLVVTPREADPTLDDHVMTALAWRVHPPPELHAIVASAREIATLLHPPETDVS